MKNIKMKFNTTFLVRLLLVLFLIEGPSSRHSRGLPNGSGALHSMFCKRLETDVYFKKINRPPSSNSIFKIAGKFTRFSHLIEVENSEQMVLSLCELAYYW